MSKKQKGEKPVESASSGTPQTPPATPEVPAKSVTVETVAQSAAPQPEPKKEAMSENNQTPETTQAPQSTELAVVETSTSSQAYMMELAQKLPAKYRMDVIQTVRPTPEQLMTVVEKLPADVQMQMMRLVAKTNPKKQGMHTARTGFNPIGIKMYHGTGNDPLRPSKLPAGEFYTEESRALGENFVGVVIGLYEGRTKWPDKEKGEEGKAPLCYSLDRLVGTKYGECTKCPYATGKYTEGGCGQDMTVFLMDKDMTGIYSFQFSKSSASNGFALKKILEKGENIWDRWYNFQIEKREKKEQNQVWYATKASPVNDPKNPQAGATDKTMHPLFAQLSAIVDVDVYYPKLAAVYSSKKESAPALATDGPTINVDEIGGSISGDNGDFGGGPNV
jgi:hypothetical protein